VKKKPQTAALLDLRESLHGDPDVGDGAERDVLDWILPLGHVVVFGNIVISHDDSEGGGLWVGDLEVEVFLPLRQGLVLLNAGFLLLGVVERKDAISIGAANGVHFRNFLGFNKFDVEL